VLGDAGRLEQALEMIGRQAGHTRRAGLGPWTQLGNQAQRLQVLALMGRHEQVLAEAGDLRARMADLPGRAGDEEAVEPWNVRETLLGAGYASTVALGRWQQALDLNAEVTASTRQRGAGVHELTRTRFNDAGPLIRLGRLAEAGQLLAGCQQVFEDHRDTARLARVLSARADLEAELRHGQAAAEFGRAALRLAYAQPELRGIAISHHNLAGYLRAAGGDRPERRAHRLAAALLFALADMTHELVVTMRTLADEQGEDTASWLPSTVAEVVAAAELTDGVRLGELLAALEPDPRTVEEALAGILQAAAEAPTDDRVGVAVLAACRGDQEAAARLEPFLGEMSRAPEWVALAGVLRRILGGERGTALLDGLDLVSTAIAREVLRRADGGDGEPAA